MTSPKNGKGGGNQLSRLPKKEGKPFVESFLPLVAILAGLLLILAVPDLIGAQDMFDYAKAFLIALSATGVAYGVNRLAIDHGARQAAIGTSFALALSLGSISIVGNGLAMATYGGLVIERTEVLRLQMFGTEVNSYIDHNVKSAGTSAQVLPVLISVTHDLQEKANCEEQNGCVSLTTQGGKGRTWGAVETRRQQAEATRNAVGELEQSRQVAAARLSGLQSEFHAAIANEVLSASERRIQLQDIWASIGRQISRLQETVPDSVIRAYAKDLQQGALINGNANASTHFSSILEGHGRALESVLQQAEQEAMDPPAFPARTGVSDTLRFIGFFAPIAIIIFVIELVFPISLWLYTYFGFLARVRDDG